MPKYLIKKVKDERGAWIPVYGIDQQDLDAKIAARKAEFDELKRLADNPPVYAYAKTWFYRYTKDLSAARKQDYANAINNHICPVIGAIQIAKVTVDDIDAVMDRCVDLSRSSQDKITAALRKIFAAARRSKLIGEDPCESLVAGGKKAPEKKALTDAQCQLLLDTVEGSQAELFVMVAMYTGMRREEVLGLQWDCVHLDDEAPYIRVEHACRWEHNQPEVNNKLKSKKALRSIPIPPQLAGWLKAQQAVSNSDYVVHDRDGMACSGSAFRNMWHYIERRSTGPAKRMELQPDGTKKQVTIMKKLGDVSPNSKVVVALDFEVTPHLLRHTYATKLILAGTNIKVVQAIMGHEKVETTLNIYTHLFENRPEDNIGAVQAAFGFAKP